MKRRVTSDWRVRRLASRVRVLYWLAALAAMSAVVGMGCVPSAAAADIGKIQERVAGSLRGWVPAAGSTRSVRLPIAWEVTFFSGTGAAHRTESYRDVWEVEVREGGSGLRLRSSRGVLEVRGDTTALATVGGSSIHLRPSDLGRLLGIIAPSQVSEATKAGEEPSISMKLLSGVSQSMSIPIGSHERCEVRLQFDTPEV